MFKAGTKEAKASKRDKRKKRKEYDQVLGHFTETDVKAPGLLLGTGLVLLLCLCFCCTTTLDKRAARARHGRRNLQKEKETSNMVEEQKTTV